MSVTACNIYRKRARFQIREENTHVVHYRIHTDANDDPVTVREGAQNISAGGNDTLPLRYQEHPEDPGAYVLAIDIQEQQPNNFRVWNAQVTYGPVPPGPNFDGDPLLWPATYRITYKMISKTVTRDAFGNPILNLARQPVAVAPRDDWAIPVLVVEKNYAAVEDIIAIQLGFQRTTNDDTWFTTPAGSANFETIIASDLKRRNGVEYYTGTMSINLDLEAGQQPQTLAVENQGWEYWDRDPNWGAPMGTFDIIDGEQVLRVDQKFPDGFDDIDPDDPNNPPNLVAVHGEDGAPLHAPQYMTPTGQRPSAGDPGLYKLYYDHIRRVDYGGLGIGG